MVASSQFSWNFPLAAFFIPYCSRQPSQRTLPPPFSSAPTPTPWSRLFRLRLCRPRLDTQSYPPLNFPTPSGKRPPPLPPHPLHLTYSSDGGKKRKALLSQPSEKGEEYRKRSPFLLLLLLFFCSWQTSLGDGDGPLPPLPQSVRPSVVRLLSTSSYARKQLLSSPSSSPGPFPPPPPSAFLPTLSPPLIGRGRTIKEKVGPMGGVFFAPGGSYSPSLLPSPFCPATSSYALFLVSGILPPAHQSTKTWM